MHTRRGDQLGPALGEGYFKTTLPGQHLLRTSLANRRLTDTERAADLLILLVRPRGLTEANTID